MQPSYIFFIFLLSSIYLTSVCFKEVVPCAEAGSLVKTFALAYFEGGFLNFTRTPVATPFPYKKPTAKDREFFVFLPPGCAAFTQKNSLLAVNLDHDCSILLIVRGCRKGHNDVSVVAFHIRDFACAEVVLEYIKQAFEPKFVVDIFYTTFYSADCLQSLEKASKASESDRCRLSRILQFSDYKQKMINLFLSWCNVHTVSNIDISRDFGSIKSAIHSDILTTVLVDSLGFLYSASLIADGWLCAHPSSCDLLDKFCSLCSTSQIEENLKDPVLGRVESLIAQKALYVEESSPGKRIIIAKRYKFFPNGILRQASGGLFFIEHALHDILRLGEQDLLISPPTS